MGLLLIPPSPLCAGSYSVTVTMPTGVNGSKPGHNGTEEFITPLRSAGFPHFEPAATRSHGRNQRVAHRLPVEYRRCYPKRHRGPPAGLYRSVINADGCQDEAG